MGGVFSETSMSPAEFDLAFEIEVTTKYHAAWILLAQTKKGIRPEGIILGFWPHPDQAFAAYMMVGGIAWFPWATARNRVECAVNFFNRIRDEIPMMGFVTHEHKKMYETVCKHGIMRRIGTSLNVFSNQQSALFETKVTQ